MATPIKRVKKENVAILHSCTEAQRISRIELILVGNGHPEDGYVYKVIEMGKSIQEINDHLTGISGIVKDLHEEAVGKRAVIIKEASAFEKGLKIAGVALAFGMLILGYVNLTRQNRVMERRIENIGIPLIMNSRGEILTVPDSTQIKYFSNDSISFTIKRNGTDIDP